MTSSVTDDRCLVLWWKEAKEEEEAQEEEATNDNAEDDVVFGVWALLDECFGALLTIYVTFRVPAMYVATLSACLCLVRDTRRALVGTLTTVFRTHFPVRRIPGCFVSAFFETHVGHRAVLWQRCGRFTRP